MKLSRRQFLTLTAVGGVSLLSVRSTQAHTLYCPILMYHYIAHPPEGANAVLTDLTVTPELFDQQLDYLLEAGYTTITMEQLWAGLTDGVTLPEKPVILSFDDGYDNAYGAATPRLLARNMVGTFFIVRDFMGQPGYLSWGMAAEMKNVGMEIGNHSTTHPNLASLSYTAQYDEIENCAAAIGDALGERPQFFCYPLGRYNGETIRALKASGHLAAVTTSDGTIQYRADSFRMSRARVRHTTQVSTLAWLLNRYL